MKCAPQRAQKSQCSSTRHPQLPHSETAPPAWRQMNAMLGDSSALSRSGSLPERAMRSASSRRA